MADDVRYDYVVVGGGPAGATLAARLSEDARLQVLLLEAGRASHPVSRLPVSFGLLIHNAAANWLYRSDPEKQTAMREIPVPRGKLLGGSSAINGLVYVRGQPQDYDTWAQMGCRGWNWEQLAPVFRRMEHYEGPQSGERGEDGPLRVSEVPDRNPLYDAIKQAAVAAGYKINPDYNSPDQDGIGTTQTTISRGRRQSTHEAYLKPAMARANLHVVTEAQTERLLLEGKRCLGVEYTRRGERVQVRAGREVVLCAGGVASPQLLELSGIGRPDVLAEHGIAVQHALPAVGENFRDHINARIQWRITDRSVSYNHMARGWRMGQEVLKYITKGTGFLSLPSAPLVAFLKTRRDMETPDVQMHLVPYAVKNPKLRQLHPFPAMTVSCYQLRPESLGSIHIRSADVRVQPAIRFNFLADRIDQMAMSEGFRMMRRIVEAQPLDAFRGDEYSPGKGVSTEAEILDYIRANSETAYHPIGTCRMGPEGANTVVDEQLRVHGLAGLRVADASIFPTMPSGNTNAPSIMVGEKAAELLRSAA